MKLQVRPIISESSWLSDLYERLDGTSQIKCQVWWPEIKLTFRYLMILLCSCWSIFWYLWLVGCFGLNGPLRQYFSLYRAVSQRVGEREERIDESKNVQTTPTRSYCKRNRLLPYCNQNCRMPQHWRFNQHHRTTRPPPNLVLVDLINCKGGHPRWV